jgi:hypothetical protein
MERPKAAPVTSIGPPQAGPGGAGALLSAQAIKGTGIAASRSMALSALMTG